VVIDASAVVAILLAEPEAAALERALGRDDVRLLSAPTRTEMSIVIHGRGGLPAVQTLRTFLENTGAVDVPFDRALADLAADAYAKFGKGNHRARLNLGDCFTYAVAKRTGEPILCVGDDFARTDVAVVALGD